MRKLEARRALAPVGVEEHPRACELLAQLADERARHHGDAILAALPMAHDDLAAREIEILDAQAHAFHRPHPGSVEQAGDQRVRTRHERKHAAHLVAREDRGQPPGPLGPADVAEPGQLDAEHFPVEKQQRRQRLVVRRRGDVALVRQMIEECDHLFAGHLAGVTHGMEADETARPLHLRLLGAVAAVEVANATPDLVEKARGSAAVGTLGR